MNKQGPGKIEYLDRDWNPVTGCLHKCCPWCYLKRYEKRGLISMEPAYHYSCLFEPERVKTPSRIGVCFTGDLFGEWVPREWIQNVLNICQQAGNERHRFVFLTKNPRRYREFETEIERLTNCWFGVSTTGSEAERERMVAFYGCLLGGRRFISLEPYTGGAAHYVYPEKIDWLIIGGLTGKGAKKPPTDDLKWIVESAGNYCPVFVKSNAGPGSQEYPDGLKMEGK